MSYFTLVLGFVIVGTYTYWTNYPYKTIEFKNNPFPPSNPEVTRGERLRYKVDYCKFTDENPTVVKYFIDGVIYETSPTVGVMTEGCYIDEVDVYIPRALPPGNYSIKIVAIFHPNPIRTITITSNTQQFEVK